MEGENTPSQAIKHWFYAILNHQTMMEELLSVQKERVFVSFLEINYCQDLFQGAISYLYPQKHKFMRSVITGKG